MSKRQKKKESPVQSEESALPESVELAADVAEQGDEIIAEVVEVESIEMIVGEEGLAAIAEEAAGENAETAESTETAADEPESAGEEAIEEAAGPVLRWDLSQIVEAILFASQKPVSVKELQSVLKGAADADKENPSVASFAKVPEARLRAAIEALEAACADSTRAYEVRETAAGWQLVTKPEFAPWLRQLFPENRPARLSAPALETLAIIAYRQPITRADIEAVRGVAVDGVMQTLLDRGLVKIAGRAEIPGRPLLYETTISFMDHFGLKDLDDLPNATELRKIDLPQAPLPEQAAQPAPEEPAAFSQSSEPDNAPVEASPETETPPTP